MNESLGPDIVGPSSFEKAANTIEPPSSKKRPIAIWLIAGVLACLSVIAWLTLRTVPTVSNAVAIENGKRLLTATRVLAVVAHPDDAEWYVGGTLRMLSNLGAEVHVVVATDGEAGSNRDGVDDLGALRREEQLAAAEINAYGHIYFLGLPDRGAAAARELRTDISAIWNRVKPNVVLTFDPEYPSLPYLHTDHQGVGRVTLDKWHAIKADRPPMYLWQTRRPNAAVDISTVIDTKIRALSMHKSQGLGQRADRHRPFARSAGQMFGFEFAEVYRVIR